MCMRAHEREMMRGARLFTTHAMITNRLITVRTLLLPSPHRARCGHCCSSVARMALTSSIYCSLGTALVVRQFSTWGRHRREGGGGWGWGAGKMCQVCLAVSVPLLSTVICTVCRIVCKSVLSRVTGTVGLPGVPMGCIKPSWPRCGQQTILLVRQHKGCGSKPLFDPSHHFE